MNFWGRGTSIFDRIIAYFAEFALPSGKARGKDRFLVHRHWALGRKIRVYDKDLKFIFFERVKPFKSRLMNKLAIVSLLSLVPFAQAFAMTVTPSSKSISLSSANTSGGNISFAQTSDMVESHVEYNTVQVTDYITQAVWGDSTCATTILVEGSSEWKFNPNKRSDDFKRLDSASTNAQKADALADAVQGLGKEYAAALIKARYLTSTPSGWNDFKRQIEAATAAGIIKPVHQTQILTTYNYDNHIRLGYYFDTTPQTKVVYEPCQVITGYQQVPYGSHPETQATTVTTKVGVIARNVSLNVAAGAVLMPWESDSLTLTFGDVNSISASEARYNGYSVTMSESIQSIENYNGTVEKVNTTINVNPIGRKRPDASVLGDLVKTSVLSVNGGLSTFTTLSDTMRNIAAVRSTRGDVTLVSELYSCKLNFLGACTFSSWKLVEKKEVVADRTDLTTVFATRATGNKYMVKTSLNFSRSNLYSGAAVDQIKTNEVKLK